MNITRVGVVGAGTMGAGIAQVAAEHGYDVMLQDISQEFLDRGRKNIERQLNRAVERGRMSEADRDAVLARLHTSTSVEDLADRDLVIEAATERLDLKKDIFKRLGEVVRPDCILSTNTSSLPVAEMAGATCNPERVVGTHFFNPPAVMKLVEVVMPITVDERYVDATVEFISSLDKTAIRAKDTPAFVVNRIAVPMMLDAARVLEAGIASAEDIDKGCQLGLGHSMGPLATMDLIGIDTMVLVADALYEEYGRDEYKAPPLMRRLVAANRLGRKTNHGFFEYGET